MKSAARDPESTDEPLQLVRSTFVGEETMKISGQIDRVDIARDQTLVAYDYKLSKGARKEDIYEGRTLQIPIYLEALEQLFFPGTRDRRRWLLHFARRRRATKHRHVSQRF